MLHKVVHTLEVPCVQFDLARELPGHARHDATVDEPRLTGVA